LRVRNFSETESKGWKGTTDKPSRIRARSQARTQVQTAGLSLRVPQRKRIIRGSLPPGEHDRLQWPQKNSVWKEITLKQNDLAGTQVMNQ